MIDISGKTKTVIAMVHIRALPGAPDYDRTAGIDGLIDWAAHDLRKLQDGGIDAVMFGNEFDRPYVLKATPESLAAMTAVVTALKPEIRVPFGVNYLWDPVATVALAAATGARFGREIFTGVYASDMGLWEPRCAEALRLRANLGCEDVKLLFNVNAEFATPLDSRSTEQRAKSAVFSSLADAICVSGPMTGEAVDVDRLRKVKAAVGAVPVLANTGVTVDTVGDILSVADGCVIGTHLKVDGNTWNPVDGDRVARFMDRVNTLR